MDNIQITLNSNKGRLLGDIRILNKVRKELRIKHPGAFFIRKSGARGFDGHVYMITEAGYFAIGNLPFILEELDKYNIDIELIDNREALTGLKTKAPKYVGRFKLRDYQYEAVKAVVSRTVMGVPFPLGVLDMATNAGKTLIILGIHKAIKGSKTLILINSSLLYKQLLKELPDALEEDIGYVQGKQAVFKDVTIAMVQTLSAKSKVYQQELSQFTTVLVDEADLADNKTYKTCLNACYNAVCRVGLSGSIFMSTLAKHRLKNFNLKSIFSNTVYSVTKRDLMDKGFSTELIIKIVQGNKEYTDKRFDSYLEAYKKMISFNKKRHRRIVERLQFNLQYERLPALVICQFHDHIEDLYPIVKEAFPNLTVKFIHHKVKERASIVNQFKEGKVDILIASFIVKRGQNMPTIKYILNAAGSDSNETISQIMGRGERKDKSKDRVYLDDMFDEGQYIKRHSKHRVNYYKKERVKVIKLV